MDRLYEAAAKYVALQQYEYEFVLSKSRKKKILNVNFLDEDFFHLTGMQYLTDIDIQRNRKKTLDNILVKRKITERMLQKSRYYFQPKPDKDVKSRIEELRFLEEYLDTDNIIRIFNIRNQKNMYSRINAEYIIESKMKGCEKPVYIFLKHREENSDYCCVVSFFKKDQVVYGGDIMYWMQKKKIIINTGEEEILQKHPDYDEFILSQ
ncbi:MAG: PBECR4 domain-containing protein [Wujia sp.]